MIEPWRGNPAIRGTRFGASAAGGCLSGKELFYVVLSPARRTSRIDGPRAQRVAIEMQSQGFQSQLTAHSSQLTAHSSQLTAHSSQLTAHSSQLTAHSSQLTAHSLGERGFRSSPLSKIFLKKFSTSSTPGNNRPCKGFTLIELMVVVTLLGIFASIAVPAFSSLIANNRVESSASEFYAVLMAARADAVTQRTATTLSKVDSGNWELRQSSETQRTISFPDSVTLSSAPDSLTFRSDGTAESTSFVFITSKSDRSYTITVQLSGAIRLSGPTTTPSS